MPVRRFERDNSSGYGSLGATQLSPGFITRYLIWAEANNINALTPNSPISGENPQRRIYTILHAWKFTALSFDLDIMQTYNAEISKRRFGTVMCRHRGYVTAEINVSFADVMSPFPCMTVVNFIGNSSQEVEIPCDEPPSDAIFTPVQTSNFVPCSGAGLLTFNAGAINNSSQKTVLADDVTFHPGRGLNSYIFGAGYRYITNRVSASDFALSPEVVVINQ